MNKYKSLADAQSGSFHVQVKSYNNINSICSLVGINFSKYQINLDDVTEIYNDLEQIIKHNLSKVLENKEKEFYQKLPPKSNEECQIRGSYSVVDGV